MPCFDNSTAEDISSIDDSTEDEDPLFGNFEGDTTLKKLLSPKKRKKTGDNINKITKHRQKLSDKQSFSNSTGDILQQLKCRMGDSLEKELGFSLNNFKSKPSLVESYGFQKLLDEVKKEKEIEDIIENESLEEMKKAFAETEINKWIEDHVNNEFLTAEVSGVKINQKWISSLRKLLREIVTNNEMRLDESIIRSSLSKYPQYYNFRCFTANNHIKIPSIGFVEYLIEKNKTNTLLYSKNVKYVENFRTNGIDGEAPGKRQILETLGCDSNMMLNMHQKALRSFDSKDLLPSLGCGFEILKFVQLINTTRFEIFDKNEVIRILILMCSDYNARFDYTHYNYEGGYFTGREIGLLKLWEYRSDDDLSIIMYDTLRMEPELWFETIRSFNGTSCSNDIVFKGKLMLEFLHNNEPHKSNNKLREEESTVEELFNNFCEYLNKWSNDKLSEKDEVLLDVIKWKIELIKDWLLAINVTLKKWGVDHSRDKSIKCISESLNRLKTNYFVNFDKSLNAIVPQCKKIIDFIYHEIPNIEVNDVFAE